MRDLTLNSLFFSASDGEAGGAAESALGQGEEALVALQGEVEQLLPKFSRKALEQEIMAKIGEVLDVGLEELLGSSWTKYKGFQAYADPAQYPPEETILVPLANHQIQSSHHPRVDLMIKDIVLGSISLDVELSAALEGIVLKIQGGRIREVRAGSCQASGTLGVSLTTKAGTKELLNLEKETPKFQLSDSIQLGEGVVIPRLDMAAGA